MRKGDTLIEVAIAIAVFSLVAISAVAVVNSSTSAAQSALELTVTREEIDAQAEALRFIHSSYIAGGQSNATDNEKYLQLWKRITENAIKSTSSSLYKTALSYSPATCDDLYNTSSSSSIFKQRAFVINTHYLGNPVNFSGGSASAISRTRYLEKTILRSNESGTYNTKFVKAETYPRILYNSSIANDDSVLNTSANNTAVTSSFYTDEINRAEGIFIIAVKDPNSTSIVDDGVVQTSKSAYYDFYIRTCWFAPGADRPSTISTVVRLQDPETIVYD